MVKSDNRLLSSTKDDSFWNTCFYNPFYEEIFDYFLNHLLRWTEPHLLVTFCLLILIILPIIFLVRSDDSYLKISRLYNVSRLSILTFFHRVLYIYLIFLPLSYVLKQNPPCHLPGNWKKTSFQNLFVFPYPKLASLSLTIMYISSLLFNIKKISIIISTIFLICISIHFILCGDLSISQSFGTLSLSYILHYYSQRVNFSFLHLENLILLILNLYLFIINSNSLLSFDINTKLLPYITGQFFSAFSLLFIDEYMISRYWFTRLGYAKVGKPIDLEWETGIKSSAYFSVLSSEDIITYSKNLKNDVIDSLISVLFYLIGLGIRHAWVGQIKSSVTGFL